MKALFPLVIISLAYTASVSKMEFSLSSGALSIYSSPSTLLAYSTHPLSNSEKKILPVTSPFWRSQLEAQSSYIPGLKAQS